MFTRGKININRINSKPKPQPKPVTEESKIKEATESLKEARMVKKAESFQSELPKENPVVRPVPEDKPVQPKKETGKKKKYKLEELMAEDQDKADA